MLRLNVLLVLSVVLQAVSAADQSKTFTSSDGKHRLIYAERLPSKPGAGKHGLILLFHGNTLNENSLFGRTQAALDQAGISDRWIVVGLKSQESGWNDRDDGPVTAFIEHALTTYPVDRRRVIGMGYSSGTYFITRFAQARSDLFAGAIGYVGSQSGGPTRADPAAVAELYWVTGHQDKLQPVAEPRAAALKNLAQGLPVVYHEERGMAHEYLWGQTGIDAIQWMQTLRVKRSELDPDDAAFIASFDDEAKAKKQFGDAKSWTRILAIGGPHVSKLIVRGLSNEKPAAQTNALIACTKVQVDDAIITELSHLLAGKDKKVKPAALGALVVHAAWNRPLAQRVLCDAVLAPTTALADRRAIALGLTSVVKLDLLGGFVYTRVLWTLVDLLDDDDAVLRQSAFAALEPAMTGGFSYLPSANKAGRAAAVEQWRAWVTKQSGPRPQP